MSATHAAPFHTPEPYQERRNPAHPHTDIPTAVQAATDPLEAPMTAPRLANLTGRRSVEDLPHSCRCGARWAGVSAAHCAAEGCHRTFTGVNGFDRHRIGGTCTDPATLGMRIAEGRAYEAWTGSELTEGAREAAP